MHQLNNNIQQIMKLFLELNTNAEWMMYVAAALVLLVLELDSNRDDLAKLHESLAKCALFAVGNIFYLSSSKVASLHENLAAQNGHVLH
ncbi:hypothetical protein F2Q69_00022967 [Brassica cretica]|uniref:Uncharacterized protein n=1 Tax=Brassica cretica TaxID=69181 RepID=A0A8S9Q806_BRACR|nr:hypothetical protein F2Q69_00022967 [Brassica cretica]